MLCIKNKTFCFEFPIQSDYLPFKNLSLQCNDGILKTTYNGLLSSFTWYKIIVSNCQWKGIDVYSLQFIEKKDLKISQFCNDYMNLINKEYSKLIDLTENICSLAPELPKAKEVNINISQIPKSPNLIIRQTNNSQKLQQNAQYKLANYVGKNNFSINNAISNQEECIDYSLLFLMKYQYNYIYDMYLTLLTFNSLKENILNKDIYDFHITNLLYYIVNNFTLLSKMKRFKIEVKSQVENEIQCCYEPIRVCIFNVLLFILNNSNYEKEKHLEVNIKHDKFGKGIMSFYKLYFKFSDPNPIIKYSQLNELFNKLKTTDISNLDYDLLKLLDIGLITTFYIVSKIFNSEEITIISNKESHNVTIIITFFANASSSDVRLSNQIQNKSSKSIYPTKIFHKKSPCLIEDEAVYKILNKVFKFKPPKDSEDSNKAVETKHNDLEDSDEEDQDEDYIQENESVELDEKKYRELHHELGVVRKFSLAKYLLEKKKLTINDISINKTVKKYAQTNINIPNTIKYKLDNTELMKNIKYCNPPRILIVEDNVYGRMNIRENLKNMDIPLVLDTAGDGKEAIEKFNNLFHQGFLFDIIFMDIYLPEILGFEASSRIRKMESRFKNIRTKIIAVTAEGKFEMDTKLFDYFCKHYIIYILYFCVIIYTVEKPIKINSFSQYISKYIEESKNYKRPHMKINN